ncbi:MAG: hypothetical protein ACI9JM_002296, partial [Halioglobus sp.]
PKQIAALTMVPELISLIVPLIPKPDQRNYLPYGTTRSSMRSSALFIMRVYWKIQPVAGQPGMQIVLALRHVLI